MVGVSPAATPSGPRILLRRLREVMGGEGAAQARMDQLVTTIAANMVAEVCSIYLLRDGVLELFATEGLNRDAVHQTTLRIGEGLVGQIAQLAKPMALSEARSHPNFAARPETGEEDYHSLMGVPVLRGGRVVGVLVLQNRSNRDYSNDEVEAMQTIAMVLAEMVGGALQEEAPGVGAIGTDGLPRRLAGLSLNEGLARGVAVLHAPRIVVERHVADDIDLETARLTTALTELRDQVDGMLQAAVAEPGGESRKPTVCSPMTRAGWGVCMMPFRAVSRRRRRWSGCRSKTAPVCLKYPTLICGSGYMIWRIFPIA